jgi:molybdate transport system substrate-binding protein
VPKVLTFGLILAAWAAPALRAVPLNVSAAVSLTEALEQIGAAYAKSGAGEVRLNLAASNTIARQMIAGAPVDVFISADQAQMDLVERSGALVPGTRVDVVRNRLAIVATPERAPLLKSAHALADRAIRRIAIGDPAAVPAGVYAREYLQHAGLWSALSAKLVPTPSVRAALAAVDREAADAAIVYVTDAVAAKSARIAAIIPPNEGPLIVYPAAIGARSHDTAAAARFIAFLRGPEASKIFARLGFLPISARGR